jgi:hypothetical protein
VTDEEARAALIRVTGGNFRLLPRLLTQIARLMEINAVHPITRHLVEAARESWVMGMAYRMCFRQILCKKYRHLICKVTTPAGGVIRLRYLANRRCSRSVPHVRGVYLSRGGSAPSSDGQELVAGQGREAKPTPEASPALSRALIVGLRLVPHHPEGHLADPPKFLSKSLSNRPVDLHDTRAPLRRHPQRGAGWGMFRVYGDRQHLVRRPAGPRLSRSCGVLDRTGCVAPNIPFVMARRSRLFPSPASRYHIEQ